jgi:hypothetical protein
VPGETLGHGPGSNAVLPMLPCEGVAWYSVLQGAWSVVGEVKGCNNCESSSICRFAFVFISSLLVMFILNLCISVVALI